MKGQRDFIEKQTLKISNAWRETERGRGRFSIRGHGRDRQNRELIKCCKFHNLWHYQSEDPSWNENANYAKLNNKK